MGIWGKKKNVRAVKGGGWLHAGGVDEPPMAYGRPTHAQHVYLPFYQGDMTYTRKSQSILSSVSALINVCCTSLALAS